MVLGDQTDESQNRIQGQFPAQHPNWAKRATPEGSIKEHKPSKRRVDSKEENTDPIKEYKPSKRRAGSKEDNGTVNTLDGEKKKGSFWGAINLFQSN